MYFPASRAAPLACVLECLQFAASSPVDAEFCYLGASDTGTVAAKGAVCGPYARGKPLAGTVLSFGVVVAVRSFGVVTDAGDMCT